MFLWRNKKNYPRIITKYSSLTGGISIAASMAQSDAYLTGDQEVTGFIPAGSSNILWWRWIMKYFLLSDSLPSAVFQKGSCQFRQENVHKYYVEN